MIVAGFRLEDFNSLSIGAAQVAAAIAVAAAAGATMDGRNGHFRVFDSHAASI